MADDSWTPTRFGGLRRPTQGSSDAQSGALTGRASEIRSLPLGLRIEWARGIGLPEKSYLRRWSFGHRKIGSVRLHQWLGPDDDRAPHDHPWWFITFVIKGSYLDYTPSPDPSQVMTGELVPRWAVRYRPARHRHTVDPFKSTWTLVVTGPVVRKWGFWPYESGRRKFVKANKWFASRGHHTWKES